MATDMTLGPHPAAIPASTGQLNRDDRVALLRFMLLMRAIEQRAMSLYRQGRVPGSFYDGFGQEAVSAGAAFAMGPADRLCVLHRDLAAHLVRGVTPARVFAQYMGRAGGVTEGREGNVHFGDRALGCVGMVSMLPDMMLVAAGMAMAFRMRGEARCALTWVGDGATSRGDFHEAMNWSAVQRLPVIFVLENNQYAYSTPLSLQFAVDPVERARTYGFPGERVDDMRYVPPELLSAWRERDPIERQEKRLAALGVDVESLRAEVAREVERAALQALELPMPDPAGARSGVFCEAEAEPLGDGQAPWSGFAEASDA